MEIDLNVMCFAIHSYELKQGVQGGWDMSVLTLLNRHMMDWDMIEGVRPSVERGMSAS